MKSKSKSGEKLRTTHSKKTYLLSKEAIKNIEALAKRLETTREKAIEFSIIKTLDSQDFDESTRDQIKRIDLNVETLLLQII